MPRPSPSTALPEAVAVVDPHRLDQPQPASELAGVGVAFKLAAAISGDFNRVTVKEVEALMKGSGSGRVER